MNATQFEIFYKGTYYTITNFYVSKEGEVYRLNKYKDGHSKWKPVSVYVNQVHNNFKYRRFHIRKDNINKPVFLHDILGQLYVPGYKRGLVCDHIDGDPLNNDINNLQWITKEENSRKGWEDQTDEQKAERIRNYSKAIKKAHAEGKYDEHMKRLAKLNTKTPPEAQNSPKFELLDGPGTILPTEEEMLKMAEYFDANHLWTKKHYEELYEEFKDDINKLIED